MNQMETVKDHKVHGMPETLWRNARSLAALAGITVSQEMPDFTDDKRHDSLDGHCAEGCPCLLDERPGIFSSWGEAFQVLGGITALMISFALMICELVRLGP